MTPHAPEQIALENCLRHALEEFEQSDRENVKLRRRVTDLEAELVRRDADDALRGARCACTGYQRRFHVALAVASGALVSAVAGWACWWMK